MGTHDPEPPGLLGPFPEALTRAYAPSLRFKPGDLHLSRDPANCMQHRLFECCCCFLFWCGERVLFNQLPSRVYIPPKVKTHPSSPGSQNLNPSAWQNIPDCVLLLHGPSRQLAARKETHTHAHTHTPQKCPFEKFKGKLRSREKLPLARGQTAHRRLKATLRTLVS